MISISVIFVDLNFSTLFKEPGKKMTVAQPKLDFWRSEGTILAYRQRAQHEPVQSSNFNSARVDHRKSPPKRLFYWTNFPEGSSSSSAPQKTSKCVIFFRSNFLEFFSRIEKNWSSNFQKAKKCVNFLLQIITLRLGLFSRFW